MSARTQKTSTDIHWNERAVKEADRRRVNIHDLVQRQVENDFIFKWLRPDDRLLEVGCGNGFLTEELRGRVKHVTGFDFSEAMIAEAQAHVGERNNRFHVGSVLSPETTSETFDAVVCVRVLINLADVKEQQAAVRNMARWTRPGGRLILVEGYSEGFDSLNALRARCGVAPLAPAAINFYSPFEAMKSAVLEQFDIAEEWHSGMYDLLTRIVYPLLAGAEQATGPADFHERIAPLARALNPDDLKPLARLRGLALVRRG